MPARMTHEQFNEIVRTRGQDQYTLLDTYQTTHLKIRFVHLACGYVFEMRPSRFICGDRCPKCGNAVKKTQVEYEAELTKHFPNEYTVLGEYVNAMTPIQTRHKCGHEWSVAPNTLLRRIRQPHAGCPRCNGKHRRTHDEFIGEVTALVGEEYAILGRYHSFRAKVHIMHNKCGGMFEMSAGGFLTGNRCPHCAMRNKTSEAVKMIEAWLSRHKRVFEREVALEGCVLQRHLKFDFLVEDKLLIEYDGSQHFTVGPSRRAELRATRKRDAFKTTFCRERSYPLLRIPYTSDPIRVLEDVLVRGMDPWEVTEREFGKMELDNA